MTKAKKAEQAEAIARLREWIKPGDTVYTILDHVSSSGMSRAIRVVLPTIRYNCNICGHDKPEGVDSDRDGCHRDTGTLNGCEGQYSRVTVDHIHPNHAIGRALDLRHWKRNGREQDALVIGGCGMDMGFHLVNSLSYALYGSGYQCLGKGCPSNYHNNYRSRIDCGGTRVYNPDGPDTGSRCYKSYYRSNRQAEGIETWPKITIAEIEGEKIEAPAACIYDADDKPQICPTCKGIGDFPNPDGPERFDLLHTDGYALRHRWL